MYGPRSTRLTFPETGEIIDIASEELFSTDTEDFLGVIDLNSRSGQIGREGLGRGGGPLAGRLSPCGERGG